MRSLVESARRWTLWKSGLPTRLPFQSLLLMYHRFCPGEGGNGLAREHFATQLDYLDRHFDVVSLEAALTPPAGDRPRVTITVDDGYRSFHEHAWPELRARGLTATIYLPTRFIDDGAWMWQDRNIYLLRDAAPGRYKLDWRGGTVPLDLTGGRSLLASLLRVYEIGRHLDVDGCLELTDRLSHGLGRVLPKQPPAAYAPMSWDQVRELQNAGVAFGSHTVNHTILTSCEAEVARREIHDSREILTERLDRPVTSFVYPNGDFDPEVRAMVEAAGYTSALATYAGYWSPSGDRLAVPRLPAPAGGESVLADRIWCWWRKFGAPAPQLASKSP